MTGFAEQAGDADDFTWVWTLRSVNGKGLDLKLRTPPGFEAAEAAIRRAKLPLHRGNISATMKLGSAGAVGGIRLDEDAFLAAVDVVRRARKISEKNGLKLKRPSADRVLSLGGLKSGSDQDAIGADIVAAVVESFTETAAALAAARLDEGAALGGVMTDQLTEMERLVDDAVRQSAGMADEIKARLQKQIAELLDDAISEDRLAQETAILAVKADVREETDRLRAHIDQARLLIANEGAVGRKLEFLAQEFAREANTLTAKAPTTAMKRTGLDLKHVVDQFREQVLNVE